KRCSRSARMGVQVRRNTQADADLAKEIYEFLKAEGKVKIKSTHRSRKNITHWETVDWEIPVTAHADYMGMVASMADLSSKAAAKIK
ncbi:hypothetical protein, partial [Marinobacter subterrani]|uniref:hypothetical protein n=1 Tax=Marinobacter subterrani TaxID=1658765 RepID=UPI002352C064